MDEGEDQQLISDARAQTLASYWADPRDPGSVMSQFVRDGTITQATVEALQHDLDTLERSSEGSESVAQAQLRALLDYAATHGPRGPVRGWEGLSDAPRYDDDISAAARPPAPAPEEPEPAEPIPIPQEEEMSALDLPFPGGWDEEDEEDR